MHHLTRQEWIRLGTVRYLSVTFVTTICPPSSPPPITDQKGEHTMNSGTPSHSSEAPVATIVWRFNVVFGAPPCRFNLKSNLVHVCESRTVLRLWDWLDCVTRVNFRWCANQKVFETSQCLGTAGRRPSISRLDFRSPLRIISIAPVSLHEYIFLFSICMLNRQLNLVISRYFMKDIIELSLNETRDSIESENVHSYKKRLWWFLATINRDKDSMRKVFRYTKNIT